jgi:hypothetical protein
MVTKTGLFKDVDETLKPEAKEKLACDGCPNAVGFALKDEVRFYCKVMHTITWSTKERTTIQVCTDNPNLQPLSQPTSNAGHDEVGISDYPDFEPDTTPFIHPK